MIKYILIAIIMTGCASAPQVIKTHNIESRTVMEHAAIPQCLIPAKPYFLRFTWELLDGNTKIGLSQEGFQDVIENFNRIKVYVGKLNESLKSCNSMIMDWNFKPPVL